MGNYSVEEIKKKLREINDVTDKVGELIFEEINDVGNSTTEMGKGVYNVLSNCKTEEELKIANDMLIAICGWSISTILENVEKRDAKGHVWLSVW
ncbi:MAG: hypothetical protein UHN47_05605 [Lachnospiraceae bacterium]|nr:hypothetical protein [Lachnospiraceae bacterium]